jgi:hypothetical protein
MTKKKNGVVCAMSGRREISAVSGQEHKGVNKVFRSFTECIRSEGQHFQHLL